MERTQVAALGEEANAPLSEMVPSPPHKSQEVRFRPAGWPLRRLSPLHHIVEDFLMDWMAQVRHILP